MIVVWPRKEGTPEEEITQLVVQMAAAAEKKDLGFITDGIERVMNAFNAAEKEDGAE